MTTVAAGHFGRDDMTVLGALALAILGFLHDMHKSAARFGGGRGYAMDPVCGMQVRTPDAPVPTTYECHDKFGAQPATYEIARERPPSESGITPIRVS